MALTGKIKMQFEQLHGVSLREVSETLFAHRKYAPYLMERADDQTLAIVGRGHTSLGKSIDPDAKDFQNQKIIRDW